MNARASVAAAALLIGAMVLALCPGPPHEPADDACADTARRAFHDPDRGSVALLACPGPCAGTSCPPPPSGAAALLMGAPIRLDVADAEELRSLPGIGPGLARRIVAERERRPFRSLGDLRRVWGVGDARIRALEGWAIAGGDQGPIDLPIESPGSSR